MEEKKEDIIDSLSSPSHSNSNSLDSIKLWNISSITNNKEKLLILSQLKKLKIRDPINLNIGGIKYSTSINTLLKHQDSFFYKMFSGHFKIKPNIGKDRDKSFFIDRDGTNFRYILNYLRDGYLIINDDNEILKKELLFEAQFYQIQPLISILSPKIDSKIIKNEFHLKVLENWISMELLRDNDNQNGGDKVVNFPKLQFKLLYRASKHGFESSQFHRYCDHKRNTVCIIKANETIFGGYTSIPWESSNDGRAVDQIHCNNKSTKTFTFCLDSNSDIWRNKYNITKPEKWTYCGINQLSYLQNPCYSVYHHRSFGPVFGYRPCFKNKYNGDLCSHIAIGNNCHKQLNSRIDSFVGESLSVRKHMTDSYYVQDYECFQIIQTNN